jgi:hypothetical protein
MQALLMSLRGAGRLAEVYHEARIWASHETTQVSRDEQ